MRVLPVLFILQLLALLSFGQPKIGKINGVVKDGDGKSLAAVTISLLKIKDSSIAKVAVTNNSGLFEFENIAIGNYLLSVTHVGYANWFSKTFEIKADHAAITFNDIALQSSGASLGQVTVVGKRPLIENKIDKMVVNVDA